MAGKPGEKTTTTNPDSDPTGKEPGRLGVDDRGNVTWEWRESDDLLADDALGDVERLNALVDPRLDVLEDDGARDDPRSVKPKRLKTGYDPYESGALGKQDWKKKRNLKELSKWIELRKNMSDKKDDE